MNEQNYYEPLLRSGLRKRGFTQDEIDHVHCSEHSGRWKLSIVDATMELSTRLLSVLVEAGLMTKPVILPHRSQVEVALGGGKTKVN
jgi:hypothetical protein